jgi:hypothetical protein
MERTTLPNQPANLAGGRRVIDFDLGDGNFARVTLGVSGIVRGDRVEVEAKAYQLDAAGNFVHAPDGEVSCTNRTTHVIALSGVVSDPPTHTLRPGWIRIVGDYTPESLGEEYERGTGKPPTGEANASGLYLDTATGTAFRFDALGEVERIAENKAAEMGNVIRQSEQLSAFSL